MLEKFAWDIRLKWFVGSISNFASASMMTEEVILIIWCLIWCAPEIACHWNEIFSVLLLGYPKKWFPTPGCALSKKLFDVCPGWSPFSVQTPDPPPSVRPNALALHVTISFHFRFDSKVQHKVFVTPWSDNADASDFFLETFLQNYLNILSSAVSPP